MCPLSGVERFPLFGGFQCTNFSGRAIGTGNNVRYIEVVRSWEGPLIEVPLYTEGRKSKYFPRGESHSGRMQEWVIRIPSIPILVSVAFPSLLYVNNTVQHD